MGCSKYNTLQMERHEINWHRPSTSAPGFSPVGFTYASLMPSGIPAPGFQPPGYAPPGPSQQLTDVVGEVVTNRGVKRPRADRMDGTQDSAWRLVNIGNRPGSVDFQNEFYQIFDTRERDSPIKKTQQLDGDDERLVDNNPWTRCLDVCETAEDFKAFFTNVIMQMMYVSGESAEPSTETTGIIEDIVRQQVIEILRSCTDLATRRGSRTITINDLIFQIRDDAPKVSRLRTFLSWKDVRKNVRDSEDKGGEPDVGAGEDPVGGVVAGPVDETAKKNKKQKVGLLWDPNSFYNQEVPDLEEEEDEEEEEMNHITLQRLRKADERTKAMTREEYVTWSEYRQASFTYRKGKRFREWAGFAYVLDSKPSDDIVDILGFLTFEMVQTLTEEALKIKEHEDLLKERLGNSADSNGPNGSNPKKRKQVMGLFDPPSEGRTPVEPRHVQEAFRRLQARPKKSRAMLNHTRLQPHTGLRLI